MLDLTGGQASSTRLHKHQGLTAHFPVRQGMRAVGRHRPVAPGEGSRPFQWWRQKRPDVTLLVVLLLARPLRLRETSGTVSSCCMNGV